MNVDICYLLDEVREKCEYDVYSKLHDEISALESTIEHLEQMNDANDVTIKALKEERAIVNKTHSDTLSSLHAVLTAKDVLISNSTLNHLIPEGVLHDIHYGNSK